MWLKGQVLEPGCWSGALAFLWSLSSDLPWVPDFWARNAHQIVATQDEKPKWGQPRIEVRLALTPDLGLILQSYTLGTKDATGGGISQHTGHQNADRL